MRFLLIDDSGAVRGNYAAPQKDKLFEIDGETPRALIPVEDDDPRLIRLEPPKPPSSAEIVDATLAAVKDGDVSQLEALKTRMDESM